MKAGGKVVVDNTAAITRLPIIREIPGVGVIRDLVDYAKQIGLTPGNAKTLRQQVLFELRKL